MSELTSNLAAVLDQVQRPGDFYATGTFDIHPPRLEVEGVGPIALPLLPVQAQQIAAVAEQAPYGRGTETLLDPGVRRTWQVDAARVHLSGRRWDADLAGVVARVAAQLGVNGRVEAALYKLLVYGTEDFFVAHRDTEKAPGMFATLVIVLPSDYSGGELVVSHKGQEVRLDLHREEPSEAAFAAFYADCRHEVRPITAGHRLTLIYNLLRPAGEPLPQPPDYDAEQAQVSALLRAWGTADNTPIKLIYPLEHAYTEAELGFDTLKGADAAVAGVINGAAAVAGCDLYLALVSIEESGWAEYTGGGRWDDPELEIGEVTDSRQTIHDWRHPDGHRPAMGELPFADDEVCPPGALDERDAAEPEFEEATGNAGASFDRLYQCAALVLWPRANRPVVLAQGGLAVSLPFLETLVGQWEDAGRRPDDPLRAEALALAARIRETWPTEPWARQQASKDGRGQALLGALTRLDDPEGCVHFIVGQVATGAFGPADNGALITLLGRLAPARAADLLTAIITANAPRQPTACADLLARRCAALEPETGAELDLLRAPALALLTALPSGQVTSPTVWSQAPLPESPTPELVVHTLIALARIDPDLADQALRHFLSLPAVYGMDAILLPAALVLHGSSGSEGPAVIAALRTAVLQHLEERIALPLEPPTDWVRDAQLSCSCNYCLSLGRFLASATEPVWNFRAAETHRKHVTHTVNRDRCDLDLTTVKRGSPHTLVCTKNQASYERRVCQRTLDLQYRERLGG
jgi:predicted 2-oxoglutarate/Fe(II)-dependent dioxygenase YbiX